MLSVSQIRTIQWEREVAELSDSSMVTLADAMMNSPQFWTDLVNGQWRSEQVFHEGRNILVVYVCLAAEDEIVLESMQVQ